jgi:hypothetical protein
MKAYSLSLILAAIFFVAAAAFAEEPRHAQTQSTLIKPDQVYIDKYIKKIPPHERQEYVNVKAPAYPGLNVELPSPEDSLAQKPKERPGQSLAEATRQAVHQSTEHGNGFYSPRGYKSGEVISVTAVSKD